MSPLATPQCVVDVPLARAPLNIPFQHDEHQLPSLTMQMYNNIYDSKWQGNCIALPIAYCANGMKIRMANEMTTIR